ETSARRASSALQRGLEPGPLNGFVVAGDRVRLARDPGESYPALGERLTDLLDKDALAADVLGRPLWPLRPAPPKRIGAGDRHAHRRAALDADQHHILALLHANADRRGDGLGEPLTVPPVCRRVQLLFHRPEPVQAGERELGAWHLLDPPALVPQHLDHG